MSFQLSLSTESVEVAYPDEPLFVAPDATVGEVLQLLRAQSTGSVLVCDSSTGGEGNLLGIFTQRDALRVMANSASGRGNSMMDRPVSEAMSQDPVCLPADTTVSDAITTMSAGGFRHVPIVNKDAAPTGMATVYGIMHYLVDHFPQTIYNLPPEPSIGPSDREGA